MLRALPTFSDGKNTVVFYRTKDIPGFTHKVVVNGFHHNDEGKRMYSAKPNPNAATAAYFLGICESKFIQ